MFLLLPFGAEAIPYSQNFQDQYHRILFLARAGHASEAIDLYYSYASAKGSHEAELLHGMGLCILEEGWKSSDREIQFLTLFGTGISLQEKCLHILTDAMCSPQPILQLVALSFLKRIQDEETLLALKKGMASPFVAIRLETAAILAERGDPQAVGQIEALMYKVPVEVQQLFAPLYARIGDRDAIRLMKKLLLSTSQDVRAATILSAAKFQRDDLLPQIRSLAIHCEIKQQEACAYALGALKDEQSVGQLQRMARSANPSVKLAAWQSLYHLGHRDEARCAIESMAQGGDLFAITSLAAMPGSEPLLRRLITHPNLIVRINAALSLLELRDPKALEPLQELFFHDTRELAFIPSTSPGKALKSWRAIPNACAQSKDSATILEVSLSLREDSLAKALNLPEEHFLWLAAQVFERQQNDLVPKTCELLEQLRTSRAVALLEKYQQKIGSPLIRNYCSLALFKLKEEGPYAEALRGWIQCQQGEELIRLRPVLPSEMRGSACCHSLTPSETSRLLVSALETFAASQESYGIDVLLDAIRHGHPKNKYALAGLLIRTAH